MIEEKTFFSDMCMMKAAVDIDRELIAVNTELHADLEQMLLENSSRQQSLYGNNIYYDNSEIEFDSLINPPRNREAGYPRGGRGAPFDLTLIYHGISQKEIYRQEKGINDNMWAAVVL